MTIEKIPGGDYISSELFQGGLMRFLRMLMSNHRLFSHFLYVINLRDGWLWYFPQYHAIILALVLISLGFIIADHRDGRKILKLLLDEELRRERRRALYWVRSSPRHARFSGRRS